MNDGGSPTTGRPQDDPLCPGTWMFLIGIHRPQKEKKTKQTKTECSCKLLCVYLYSLIHGCSVRSAVPLCSVFGGNPPSTFLSPSWLSHKRPFLVPVSLKHDRETPPFIFTAPSREVRSYCHLTKTLEIKRREKRVEMELRPT